MVLHIRVQSVRVLKADFEEGGLFCVRENFRDCFESWSIVVDVFLVDFGWVEWSATLDAEFDSVLALLALFQRYLAPATANFRLLSTVHWDHNQFEDDLHLVAVEVIFVCGAEQHWIQSVRCLSECPNVLVWLCPSCDYLSRVCDKFFLYIVVDCKSHETLNDFLLRFWLAWHRHTFCSVKSDLSTKWGFDGISSRFGILLQITFSKLIRVWRCKIFPKHRRRVDMRLKYRAWQIPFLVPTLLNERIAETGRHIIESTQEIKSFKITLLFDFVVCVNVLLLL